MHKDTDTATVPAARSTPQPPGGAPRTPPCPERPPTSPEFPGCRPIPLRHCDLDDYEGRFEYWDRDTEIAWVCESTTPLHEFLSHGLAGLLALIAAVRGSPIRCYGTMAPGTARRAGGALAHPASGPERVPAPGKGGVGGLSGDGGPGSTLSPTWCWRWTTRPTRGGGRWGCTRSGGFPELWVEVPEDASADRPTGLTIHRLEGGVYREAPESVAFGGWKAEEIHAALNEVALSEESSTVLDRVGRALGEREGTGPDDLPWLRRLRRQARAEGYAEEYRKGHAEGRAGTLEAFARQVLALRGIGDDALRIDPGDLAGVSDEAVRDALMQCEDAADFRARLRGLRR